MNKSLYQTHSLSRSLTVLLAPTNAGIICDQEDLYIIDTGVGTASGERILTLTQRLFPSSAVKTVINTHAHADHIGGNAFLTEKTGCEVWMPLGERGAGENRDIETLISWGGYPIRELRSTPHFYASPTFAARTLSHYEEIEFLSGSLKAFPLAGHFLDMLGFVFADSDGTRTVFLGDGLFGREYLKKYWLPYVLDVRSFKESIERISCMEADFFVPSHGEIISDIESAAELNLLAVLETEGAILSAIKKEPHTAEEIVKRVADLYGLKMKYAQFTLISCTVRSYLSYLSEQGRASFYVDHNRMLWRAL